MCRWGGYRDRGIRGAHGYLAEAFAQAIHPAGGIKALVEDSEL